MDQHVVDDEVGRGKTEVRRQFPVESGDGDRLRFFRGQVVHLDRVHRSSERIPDEEDVIGSPGQRRDGLQLDAAFLEVVLGCRP